MIDNDKIDDPEYRRWIAQCAADCSCCVECCESPCPGVLHGAFCDLMACTCDDEPEEPEESVPAPDEYAGAFTTLNLQESVRQLRDSLTPKERKILAADPSSSPPASQELIREAGRRALARLRGEDPEKP